MNFKNNMKIILMALFIFVLIACGNNGDSEDTHDPNQENAGTETVPSNGNGDPIADGDALSVTIWDSFQEPGLRQIMDEFTNETGIHVNLSIVTWNEYWTMLQAAAQGGSLPDVFWMHSAEFQRYADNQMLLDLTELIADSDRVDLDRFYSDIVELYNYDGRQYAVPKDIDTIALWYNRSMFDEAGIPYPDETWTWDTLIEVAESLTEDDGSQYGFAWGPENDQEGYHNLIYSLGGYVINEDRTLSGWDHPQTIYAMTYVERLLPFMPSLEMLAENSTHVLFESSQIAMSTFGSWMVPAFANNDYLLENAGVTVLPMSADGNRVSIYNGLGWAAAADGPNTEEAWRLIEFLGSEDMQRKQAELGITMSAFEGTSDTWINSVPEFNLQAYLDMTDNMVIRPFSRNATAWQRVAQTRLQEVWQGVSVTEILPEIAEEMNRLLEEERQ